MDGAFPDRSETGGDGAKAPGGYITKLHRVCHRGGVLLIAPDVADTTLHLGVGAVASVFPSPREELTGTRSSTRCRRSRSRAPPLAG